MEEAAANIAKKMTFGDAVLLREAENYDAEAIVTWNTKDFSPVPGLPFSPLPASCDSIET